MFKNFWQSKPASPVLALVTAITLFTNISACSFIPSQSKQASAVDNKKIPSRFTSTLLDAVYTDEVVVKNGKNIPKMKPVQVQAYGGDHGVAPAPFQSEFVENPSQGVELWSYISLGELPSEKHANILKDTFAEISTWSGLNNSKNEPIFKSVEKTAQNKQLQKPTDPKAKFPEGKLNFVTAELNLQGPPVRVILDLAFAVNSSDSGVVIIDLVNTQVFYQFFLPILNQGALRSRLEFYPYQNGYLVYAAGGIRLNGVGGLVPKDLIQEVAIAVLKKSRTSLLGL